MGARVLFQEHREAACLAEEHAAAVEEKHQKLEEEHRRLQFECRQLKSRRSMRGSSPARESREDGEEDSARQRWRRAGGEVLHRLSAGSVSFDDAPDAKPPSPTSPSRRSERSEELEQQLSSLVSERDALRADGAAWQARAQELEEEVTTLRLLLEEEAQRTETLVQQVDYLADLLEDSARPQRLPSFCVALVECACSVPVQPE